MRQPRNLTWLATAFAEQTPAVAHAAFVSPGGLPLACSHGLPADRADQLAAVASGLTSLVNGAARLLSAGSVGHTVVVMRQGTLILRPISDGSLLAVLARPECDLGLVAYQTALLSEQAEGILTR